MEELAPVDEGVPVGVPLEEVKVALVVPGPVGEVAIPVEVVVDDDAEVEEDVAVTLFFCANPVLMLAGRLSEPKSDMLTNLILIDIKHAVYILQKCIS